MQSGPGHLPVLLAAVLLASGAFFSATLDRGVRQPDSPTTPASALDPPTLQIEHRAGFLAIEGTTGSADHESALLQVIEDQFAVSDRRIDLRPGVVLPDDWESTTGAKSDTDPAFGMAGSVTHTTTPTATFAGIGGAFVVLGLGGVALALTIVFAALKLFRLLPVSLSDEVVGALK